VGRPTGVSAQRVIRDSTVMSIVIQAVAEELVFRSPVNVPSLEVQTV